jgi:hypothetical protein
MTSTGTYTETKTITQTGTNTMTGTITPTATEIMYVQPGVPHTTLEPMVLNKNRFNPLTGETVDVIFNLSTQESVTLLIYNAAGDRVRTITYNGVQSGILYTQLALWDGKDDYGKYVTNGIYYIKLKSSGTLFKVIKTVAVVKQ